MARSNRDRIREWLQTKFLPLTGQVHVYECGDVTELLQAGWPAAGLGQREGMLFAARDKAFPCPRRELVLLSSTLANYSGEHLIGLLERDALYTLTRRPHLRILLDHDLQCWDWGLSSIAPGKWESEPCQLPSSCELVKP